MNVKIRQASIADIPSLMPLIEKFYLDFGYQFKESQHTTTVRKFMMNEQLGAIWIIVSEEQCIGYVALTYGFTFGYGGRDVLIDEFYIIESQRNKGLGGWVLDKIKQEVIQLGFVALNLQVESSHTQAMNLYIRAGFRDLKRKTLTWFYE